MSTTTSRSTSLPPSDRLLRRALLGNATFSALSAAICLGLKDPVAAWIGLAAPEVFSLGVDLGLFAAGLTFLATRRDLTKTRYQIATFGVIALDVLWVLGSAVMLFAPTPLTTAGRLTVVVVAVAVADFAVFQALGWWRLRKGAPEMAPA